MRAVAALAAAGVLAGCAPLVMGGVVVGGFVATDRRTTGTQVEDQTIELKAASRVSELATLGHVNIVSYNRTVLITGEVPHADEKARVERVVAGVENVRAVVNELGIGGNSTMGSRSNDTVWPPRSRPRSSMQPTCSRTPSRSSSSAASST